MARNGRSQQRGRGALPKNVNEAQSDLQKSCPVFKGTYPERYNAGIAAIPRRSAAAILQVCASAPA